MNNTYYKILNEIASIFDMDQWDEQMNLFTGAIQSSLVRDNKILEWMSENNYEIFCINNPFQGSEILLSYLFKPPRSYNIIEKYKDIANCKSWEDILYYIIGKSFRNSYPNYPTAQNIANELNKCPDLYNGFTAYNEEEKPASGIIYRWKIKLSISSRKEYYIIILKNR